MASLRRSAFTVLVVAGLGATIPATAAADEFAAGSLIIPMDTTYQDMGMLRAFGLVYALLADGVPVHWVIRSDKAHGESERRFAEERRLVDVRCRNLEFQVQARQQFAPVG